MTTGLELGPRITDPDGLYDDLIRLHDGLDEQTSALVNAKLILLLVNHIGEPGIVRQAIELARPLPQVT